MNNLLNNKRLLWAAGGIVIVLASIAMYFIFRKDVDIAGEWDNNKAKAIALRQLEKTDWQKIDSGMFATEWVKKSGIAHETIGKFTMLHKNNREVTLLAFYTKPQNQDCHACGTYISFFEFEKNSNGWKLISSSIGALEAGSYGQPPAGISVGEIGNDIYGIFVNTYFLNTGVSEETFSIYGKTNDTYRKLLTILSAQDNSGNFKDDEVWTSKWRFVPKNTGLYDLEVTRQGAKGNKILLTMYNDYVLRHKFAISAPAGMESTFPTPERFEPLDNIIDSEGRMKAKDIYKFNGQKYVRVE